MQAGPAAAQPPAQQPRLRLRRGAELRQADDARAAQVQRSKRLRMADAGGVVLGAMPRMFQRMRQHACGQRVDLPLAADAHHLRPPRRCRARILLPQIVDELVHAGHHAQAVLGRGQLLVVVAGLAQDRHAGAVVEGAHAVAGPCRPARCRSPARWLLRRRRRAAAGRAASAGRAPAGCRAARRGTAAPAGGGR